MATRTNSLAQTNSTDANFRAWINEIHNSLIAFGWIQTSDTGQINYSTVTRPITGSTYQGYAMYRMADSLQATCPVYMRLDYGTGATGDTPSIKVRIGIGTTDGAGTIVGILNTLITTSTTGSASAIAQTTRTSGDTSSFRMHFWTGYSGSGQGWQLVVERDRDSAGAETALGVNIAVYYPSATNALVKSTQFLETAGGVGSQDACWYAMISNQTSQSGGGYVGVGPVHCQLGPMRNPMVGLFVCARNDFVNDCIYPVSIYGVIRNYLIIRPASGVASPLLNLVNADSASGMLFQ